MILFGDPRLPARFWDKVHLSGDGCWRWTSKMSHDGYAQIWFDGAHRYAHRVAFEALREPIPAGHQVDHICSIRDCVNPSHARLVTQSQNSQHRAGATRRSRSGVRGVAWDSREGRWRSQVQVDGRNHFLGNFDSIEDAKAAAVQARLRLMTHSDPGLRCEKTIGSRRPQAATAASGSPTGT